MFFILNSRVNLQRLGSGSGVVAARLVIPNSTASASLTRFFLQTTFNCQYFAAPPAFPEFEAAHSARPYRLQYSHAYAKPIR